MTSSKSSLANSLKTSCTFSAPSADANNAYSEIVVPIIRDQPPDPVASAAPSTGDYKLNLVPHVRRVSSWIEDDPGDEEENGTSTNAEAWTPYTSTIPDYDSDVESVDLDDLPPSPPPLRYQNRPVPMESKSSFDHQSHCSDSDRLSDTSKSQSCFVSSRSTWAPRHLNGLGLSISLPTLPTRRSHSILVSPVGSPIIEEEDPIKVSQTSTRTNLQLIILAMFLSPLIFGLAGFARFFRNGLKALIRAVNVLEKLVGTIKRYLESFNIFIEKLTMTIENLSLVWQRYQQTQSKNLLRITNKA